MDKIQFADSDGRIVGTPKAPKGYFVEGENGRTAGGFASREALVRAMGDPRYSTDPEFRAVVQQAVGQTGNEITFGGPSEIQQQNERRAVQAVEVTIDNVTRLMSSPEYARSAAYRAEVAAILAGTQNQWVASRPLGDQSGCTRVVMPNDSTVPGMKPRAEEFFDEQ